MNLMNKPYKHCKGNKKIQILVSINVYILKQAKCNRTKNEQTRSRRTRGERKVQETL